MTVTQAVASFKISQKKLLNELKKKYPEQVWTPDSELPEGFEQSAKAYTQEYAEASGVELPKGELVTTEDAALDNKVLLEALEYGVLEAIATMRTAEVIEAAQLDAVSDIQIYEANYNQVWSGYFEKKARSAEQRHKDRSQAKAKQLIGLNNTLGNRQGELIRTQEQIRDSQEEAQKQTQTVLDALLK